MFSFADLTGASDLMLCKAGFGTVADCIHNQTPLLFIERKGSPEVAILDQHLDDWGPFRSISQENYLAGHWQEPLEALASSNRPWTFVDPESHLQAAQIALRALRIGDE